MGCTTLLTWVSELIEESSFIYTEKTLSSILHIICVNYTHSLWVTMELQGLYIIVTNKLLVASTIICTTLIVKWTCKVKKKSCQRWE